MNTRLSDLAEIEASVWRELSRAAEDRDHEWRTPVLATVALDANGEAAPDARTVVVREVDIQARELMIYSDARAQKVGQLTAQPSGMLVFWSKTLGWQLRARVVCLVEDNGLAVSSRWARIKLSSAAQDYLSPLAPGMQIGTQAPVLDRREHFALLRSRIAAIDWLELHPDGPRRARFVEGASDWLQP